LTSDRLGSPRITTDANGNPISRRDFHPFGEEIYTQQRIAGLGYATDNVRQKFTSYERDIESELDFAEARYYKPSHGRFTSVDPLMASADISNPQTFNRYAYVGNNPINITDPTGMIWASNGSIIKWFDKAADFTKGFTEYTSLIGQVGGNYVVLNPTADNYRQVANAAQALREVAALVGTGGAVFAASATSLGVPLVIAGAYIAAMSTAGPIDATMDDCMSCGRMIQNHVNMMNKKTDELEAQVNQANKSATSQAAAGDPNDNKPSAPDAKGMTRLSKGEIKAMKKAGVDVHDYKPKKNGSNYDLFKDRDGNVYVNLKNGSGMPDPTNLNVNKFKIK